jgi:APA family basic amino acid/polyamine antiporter
LVPVLPIVSVLASFYLMLNLPAATWIRFFVWLVIGLVVYFAYGVRKSRLTTAHTGRPDVVDVRDGALARGEDARGRRR